MNRHVMENRTTVTVHQHHGSFAAYELYIDCITSRFLCLSERSFFCLIQKGDIVHQGTFVQGGIRYWKFTSDNFLKIICTVHCGAVLQRVRCEMSSSYLVATIVLSNKLIIQAKSHFLLLQAQKDTFVQSFVSAEERKRQGRKYLGGGEIQHFPLFICPVFIVW